MAETVSFVVTAQHTDASGNVRSSLPRASVSHTVTIGVLQHEILLAALTTDQLVDQGTLTNIRFLAVHSDKAILVQIANGTTGTELPIPAGGSYAMLFDADVTAVYLTNEHATDVAKVTYLIGK